MSRLHGPRSLRARLFVGIAATLAVSTIVMLAVGAALTRRSLDHDARSALDRQVDLIVAQHAANPLPTRRDDARPLPRHRAGAARDPDARAGGAAPAGRGGRRRSARRASADGTVDVRGEPFLYAARLGSGDAIVLLRSARNQSDDWQPFLVGLALAALLGAVLAAVVAFLLARAVARPVTRVADGEPPPGGGREPRPAPDRGLDRAAPALDRVQRALGGAPPRAGRRARLPALRQPRAEDAADRDPRPRRGARRRRRRAGARRRGDRARGAPARAADPRPPRPRPPAPPLVRRHARCRSTSARSRARPSPATACRHRPTASTSSSASSRRRARSPTPAARCRPSRTWSRTRSAAPPKGGTVEIVAAAGQAGGASTTAPASQPGDLERAFERFYLWDRYGADRPVGTGLGLAIVAELAAAMGGRVDGREHARARARRSRSSSSLRRCRTARLTHGLRSAERRRTRAVIASGCNHTQLGGHVT